MFRIHRPSLFFAAALTVLTYGTTASAHCNQGSHARNAANGTVQHAPAPRDVPYAVGRNRNGRTVTSVQRVDESNESYREITTRDRNGRVLNRERNYGRQYIVNRNPDGSGASISDDGLLGRYRTRARWDANGRLTEFVTDDQWDEDPPENMLNRHRFEDNRRPDRRHIPSATLRNPDGSTVSVTRTANGGREVVNRDARGNVTSRQTHPPRGR